MANQATAQKFVDALERSANDYDFDVRPNYQGRYMYGSSCVGVVSEYNSFSVAISLMEVVNGMDDIEQHEREELIEDLKLTNTDNMGMSKIYYFRNISLDKKEETAASA